MFWEIDFDWEPGLDDGERISMLYLEQLEASLPPGFYLIVIDAGLLGSYQAAKFLHEKGRMFLISCSALRPAPLWTYLRRANIFNFKTKLVRT